MVAFPGANSIYTFLVLNYFLKRNVVDFHRSLNVWIFTEILWLIFCIYEPCPHISVHFEIRSRICGISTHPQYPYAPYFGQPAIYVVPESCSILFMVIPNKSRQVYFHDRMVQVLLGYIVYSMTKCETLFTYGFFTANWW